jgi:hypothetical protein
MNHLRKLKRTSGCAVGLKPATARRIEMPWKASVESAYFHSETRVLYNNNNNNNTTNKKKKKKKKNRTPAERSHARV